MGETAWRQLNDCLNLGAGNRIIKHAINVDIKRHRPEINCIYDLNRLPWPWGDNNFDHVVAWSILEHLDIDLLAAMDEIWRVIRNRGLLEIKLPYYKAALSYDDPTHRYVANIGIFDTFDPDTDKGKTHGFYTDKKWTILEVGLNEQETGVVAKLIAVK